MEGLSLAGLSEHSGISATTIKYYLREGLLPPGEFINERRAVYTDKHLERLRLIRVLSKVAGLPLATIKSVTGYVDSQAPLPDVVVKVQDSLLDTQDLGLGVEATGGPELKNPAGETRLAEFVDKRDWQVCPSSLAYRTAGWGLEEMEKEGYGGNSRPVRDHR